MKNKILKSMMRVVCMLTIGFFMVPQKMEAKTEDPIIITANDCHGAAMHCFTFKGVIYYGKLVIK